MVRALPAPTQGLPAARDYFRERHPDPEPSTGCAARWPARVVLVTGGSSGHLAAAHKLPRPAPPPSSAGDQDKLSRRRLRRSQGQGLYYFIAYTADIADMQDCDRFVAPGRAEHGAGRRHLINNAGRLIRRLMICATTVFHDFWRTMQLNYFGAPGRTIMVARAQRRKGHVVTPAPSVSPTRRASPPTIKCALTPGPRWCQARVCRPGVTSTINMPLVRHADDRTHQDLQITCPRLARAGCDHRPGHLAGAHRHPAGDLSRSCTALVAVGDRDEHELPACSGFGGRHMTRALLQLARGAGLVADDARYSFLTLTVDTAATGAGRQAAISGRAPCSRRAFSLLPHVLTTT